MKKGIATRAGYLSDAWLTIIVTPPSWCVQMIENRDVGGRGLPMW